MAEIDEDLFRLSPHIEVRFEVLGGGVPTILIDDVYARPDEIRDMALGLSYSAPPYPYPGKLAVPPASRSLTELTQGALKTANEEYLRRVPLRNHGVPIERFRKIYTDFAIVDVHPDELSESQRIPHVDPVPVFGLVYLNREERGGTLFFEQVAPVTGEPSDRGYMRESNEAFRLRARIEPKFNRLAIYPGFVPHSGDIGSWIETDERFNNPRLTQRLVFMP